MIELDRRSVLWGFAATGAGFALGGCGSMTASDGGKALFFGDTRPVGLQLYALGEDVGKDIGGTFAQLAEIGYRDLELPGLYGMDPAEIARLAAAAGVNVTCVHVPFAPLSSPNPVTLELEPAVLAEQLGALGVGKAVVPIMPVPESARPQGDETFQQAIGRVIASEGPDLWKRTAAMLNEKAAALKPLGIALGYHNHNMEFAPQGDTTGWEILVAETDPALVSFELDLGWVASAGHDPVTELGKLAGRVGFAHVKDVGEGNEPNFALGTKPCSVGAGTLDWATILPAAAAAGVEHFYVEQEPPFTEPRIDAAKASYAYLSSLEV